MKANISQFTFDKKTRTLSVEASDLGANMPQFHQVYPDSCDEGMTLVGVFGNEVNYAVNHIERDAEGDIQYWELIPTKESVRQVPGAAGTKVIIFND